MAARVLGRTDREAEELDVTAFPDILLMLDELGAS